MPQTQLPASWTLSWRRLCVRCERCERFVSWFSPQSPGSANKGDNPMIHRTEGFPRVTKKDHATTATLATSATESPPTCFLKGPQFNNIHPPHHQHLRSVIRKIFMGAGAASLFSIFTLLPLSLQQTLLVHPAHPRSRIWGI